MPVKKTQLGTSGLKVSEICLGTMTFGNQTPARDAHAQLDRAVGVGMTFLDVAEMYPVNPVRRETVGRSEEIIGEWLAARGRRDDVQIATKVSGPSESVRAEGYDGRIILRTIEDSLRRLQTDVIDLYQLHWPMRGSYAFRQSWRYDPSAQDPAATLAHMEDVADALARAVTAGKIRAFGLSNESAWGTTRWIDSAARIGGPRVASVQNEYSLLYRLYDTDMAEMAVNEGVTLLSYSPLAAGLLTGKYLDGALPDGSRAAVDAANGGTGKLGGRRTPQAIAAVAAYKALADEVGLDLIHLSIAWQRTRPFPIIPIIGATDPAQLDHLIAGLDLRLTDDVIDRIEQTRRDHPMPF